MDVVSHYILYTNNASDSTNYAYTHIPFNVFSYPVCASINRRNQFHPLDLTWACSINFLHVHTLTRSLTYARYKLKDVESESESLATPYAYTHDVYISTNVMNMYLHTRHTGTRRKSGTISRSSFL